jgi:hypothetical protein
VNRRHPADIVTARALRHGLDRRSRTDAVVRELVELARADRRLLELALVRIERGLSDRSSRVGERARNVLESAIVLVATGSRRAPAVATVGAGGSIATRVPPAGPDGRSYG